MHAIRSLDSPSRGHSVAALEAYSAPFLEKVIEARALLAHPDSYELLFRELKRFLYLAANSPCPLPMLHSEIDDLWHQFILFTKQYREFCAQFFGRYIDHSPSLQPEPVDEKLIRSFEAQYCSHFGALAPPWKESISAFHGSSCNTCWYS